MIKNMRNLIPKQRVKYLVMLIDVTAVRVFLQTFVSANLGRKHRSSCPDSKDVWILG